MYFISSQSVFDEATFDQLETNPGGVRFSTRAPARAPRAPTRAPRAFTRALKRAPKRAPPRSQLPERTRETLKRVASLKPLLDDPLSPYQTPSQTEDESEVALSIPQTIQRSPTPEVALSLTPIDQRYKDKHEKRRQTSRHWDLVDNDTALQEYAKSQLLEVTDDELKVLVDDAYDELKAKDRRRRIEDGAIKDLVKKKLKEKVRLSAQTIPVQARQSDLLEMLKESEGSEEESEEGDLEEM